MSHRDDITGLAGDLPAATVEQIVRRTVTRALALVERPSNERSEWVRKLSRDQRRELRRRHDEVHRDWQAGRPIQRALQLSVQPYLWSITTGQDPRKVDLRNHRQLEQLFAGPYQDYVTDVCAQQLSAARLMGVEHGSWEGLMSDVQLPLVSLWVIAQSHRFGPASVFELAPGLVEKLVETDCEAVKGCEVRLPLPGLYLALPRETPLEIWNVETGWHRVSFVGMSECMVAEGPRKGRALATVAWGEPNEASRAAADDAAQVVWCGLPEDESVQASEETLSTSVQTSQDLSGVRWKDRALTGAQGRRVLHRLLINTLLYLSSPNPDVRPTQATRNDPTWHRVVEDAEAALAARSRVRIGPSHNRAWTGWSVGARVQRLRPTATDVVVRGHWRHQPHGPKRALRRHIWIEPHLRNATGVDAAGHDYVVRP